MWVAPASRAAWALAMAQPVSLWTRFVSSGVLGCQLGIPTMAFDVAADDTTESADKVVDLARRSAADSVSDTNTVNTLLVNSLVKAEKVDKITSERVLRRESDLLALALDVSDNLNGRLLDVSHVLSVRVLSQELRSANNDIDTVDSCLNGDLGIFHLIEC